MKKFILILGIMIFSINIVNAATENNLSKKLQLQDANAVSKKANNSQIYNNSSLNNPLYNSLTTGAGNFMQGITDNPSNVNSLREQYRQQSEYLGQPTENNSDE